MTADLQPYQQFLERAAIPLRLAARTKSGWPVVISLWYLYQDGRLYCATQDTARIVEYLSARPECGFEIAGDQPPYCGIRGQAVARIDPDLGIPILESLLDRYLGGRDSDLARSLLEKSSSEVAIELTPRNLFSWNFSSRMAGISFPAMGETPKPCPKNS